jgi:hypothetical protein
VSTRSAWSGVPRGLVTKLRSSGVCRRSRGPAAALVCRDDRI